MAETFDRLLDLAPLIAVIVTPSTATMQYTLDGAVIILGEDQDNLNTRRRLWMAEMAPQNAA